MPLSLRTITRWPVTKVVREKSTTASRSRVWVRAAARMSTRPCCSSGMRAATASCLTVSFTPIFFAIGLTQVDLVADDRARFGVHETIRLIRAEHAADQVAFLLARCRAGPPATPAAESEEAAGCQQNAHENRCSKAAVGARCYARATGRVIASPHDDPPNRFCRLRACSSVPAPSAHASDDGARSSKVDAKARGDPRTPHRAGYSPRHARAPCLE